jgi:hypothetical protein
MPGDGPDKERQHRETNFARRAAQRRYAFWRILAQINQFTLPAIVPLA